MSEREELAQELDGVIADCEKGNGFDDVCLRTIKRVRDALSAQPQGEPTLHGAENYSCPSCGKNYTAPPSGVREVNAEQTHVRVPVEDALESSYWRFDARRKGYSDWKGAPQSERDAFKSEFRALLRAATGKESE